MGLSCCAMERKYLGSLREVFQMSLYIHLSIYIQCLLIKLIRVDCYKKRIFLFVYHTRICSIYTHIYLLIIRIVFFLAEQTRGFDQGYPSCLPRFRFCLSSYPVTKAPRSWVHCLSAAVRSLNGTWFCFGFPSDNLKIS
jgi:hypothetical protein